MWFAVDKARLSRALFSRALMALAIALLATSCLNVQPEDPAAASAEPDPSVTEQDPSVTEQDPRGWQTVRRPYVLADGEVELHFTRPGTVRDGGEDPEADDAIAAAIRGAQTSVDLCLYEFDRHEIVDAAIEAANSGVDVRFAGDGDEIHDEGYQRLQQAGVELVLRKPHDRIMHNKFVVIDDRIVFTGSMNYSQNGLMRNNNNLLRIDSTDLAAIYAQEFQQMYERQQFGRSKTSQAFSLPVGIGNRPAEVYFSPQDSVADEVRALLQEADTRVFFMIFSFTRDDISDDLIALHESGVEVVGIFDESQARGRYSVDEKMAEAGLPVFIDGNENAVGFAGGKLHHKVMLIDPGTDSDPVVVTGSYNWSKNANENNDENLLVLHGPEYAAPFLEEFCRNLEVARPHPEIKVKPPNPCANLFTPVRINEFMPNPDGADADNEWVEIINTGTAPIDLSGWQLGDGLRGDRHVFANTVLPRGGAVVVYSGAGTVQTGTGQAGIGQTGRTVASTEYLGLANNADKIVLRDEHGVVIDRVAYQSAESGVSFNRDPDGGKEGDFVLHDTLGTGLDSSADRRADGTNWAGRANVIINELLPNPSGTDSGNEFVELVNAGSASVNLQDWQIGDGVSSDRHVFGSRTLGPGDSVVVFDSGAHTSTPNAITSSSGTLSLNNTGDTITLVDHLGRQVDQVDYPGSTDGVSLNRQSDGQANATMVDHDTIPGALGTSTPGTRVDGSLWTDNLVARVIINEVFPNPDGPDSGQEYVEIVNVGTQTADLSDWTLGDAVVDDRHVFAASTRLAPNDVIVVFDSGTHTSVPGAITATSGNLSLNNSGDVITLFDETGEVVSSVHYDNATSGKSLNRSEDGNPDALLDYHDQVSGASGDSSPGLQADGSAW